MKSNNIPSTNKKPNLFALIKPYPWHIIGLLICTVGSNALGLVIPKIISSGIDAYSKNQFQFTPLFITFLITTIVVFIFTYLQNIIQIYTSEQVARDMRKTLATKISGQSYAYIQSITPSVLLTNLTSDVDAVKLFVSQGISSIVSSLLLIIGASILLIMTNWKLALVVLTIVPIIGITFSVVLQRVRKLFRKTQEVIDWLNKIINESILGSALIRVLHSQEYEYTKFQEANSQATAIGLQILGHFAILIPIITFVASCATLAVLMLGGHFVIAGQMSLGDFAAFNTYITILFFPIIVLGFMSNVIARSGASYERIAKILAEADPKPSGTKQAIHLKGNIDFSHVSVVFGEKYALKDVSFSIKAGTKTAIIGPTAAGKTQLLYMLSGLSNPTTGTISYDGIPISEYDPISLHAHIGIVFQDSILFQMTLRENISFSQDVSDTHLNKAIKAAELTDYIQSLPQGLDTIVSERGSNLSGGQKQRLMLARALTLHPHVLLLDDFTARVDIQTENKILKNIQTLYPEITLLSITQKIATVAHYDHIILLMEGEVIAQGKHKELMKTSPEYVQMFESQQSTNHYDIQS